MPACEHLGHQTAVCQSELSLGMRQGMHRRAEYDQALPSNVDGSIPLIHEMLTVVQ